MPITLLLAPAGVGLTEVVERLSSAEQWGASSGSTPSVTYVEHDLLDHVDWTSRKFPFSHDRNMRDLLMGVTRRELMGLWKDALGRCVEAAMASGAANPVIALHPSLYAARRNEQYSTVGWAISSGHLVDVQRVVLLIDDVYDMWERLGAGAGDLFHHEEWLRRRLEAQGLDAFATFSPTGGAASATPGNERAFNSLVADSARSILGRLLAWRHLDMVAAESLASAVNAPLTALGVKHPQTALVSILDQASSTTAYLSHPISRPRRSRNAGEAWPPVVDVSNSLSQSFAGFGVVLVCPTAIDEFRLIQPNRKEDVFGRQFELGERWPALVPAEDAIVPNTSPSNRLSHIPLNAAISDETIGAIARTLESEIYAEVPFRDHYLVAHTDSFFVFRPLYEEGDFSKGVRAEITHWEQLSEFEPSRRALFAHSPQDISEVEESLRRTTRSTKIHNLVHTFLRERGLTDGQADELLSGSQPKADMLDADTPTASVTQELLRAAYQHAGRHVFFGALTALRENWLDDSRVATYVLDHDVPTASEMRHFSAFLGGSTPETPDQTYVTRIETMIGMKLGDWALHLFLGNHPAS